MNDINELFDIAIKIEKSGEAFYRDQAEKLDNPDVRTLFIYLADEEVKHQHAFRDMKNRLELQNELTTKKAEYFMFLRSYLNEIVFSEEQLKDELNKLNSAETALRFGMQRESQTILFYEEVKRLIAVDHHPAIDSVIKEEINHYLKLSELLKGTPA